MKKTIKNWNKAWKPEYIVSKKPKSVRFERREQIEHPFYDGDKICATNGHGMAVYPVGKIKLKKGTLGPKLKKGLEVPDANRVIPKRAGRFCVAFDPTLFMKVYKAIGSPTVSEGKGSTPVVYLYFDTENPHAAILMETYMKNPNQAKGVLMPIRQSDEFIQRNVAEALEAKKNVKKA